jgi:HEAT repeat protein
MVYHGHQRRGGVDDPDKSRQRWFPMIEDSQQPTGTAGHERSEEMIIRHTVSRFVLEFVKAISLTGYYPGDHPAIRNVAIRPFSLLQRLESATPELGFVTVPGQGGDETMVEGIFDEPVPFMGIVQTSMGETFAKKFTAYLERNHLVSFHLKTSIPEEEFQAFIALLVEHQTRESEGAQSVGSFVEYLVERKIFHVSGVTREELVGAGRALPWRVKVAISRLQKDLAMVPLYSDASLEKLQETKQEIIRDIIRPLRKARFIRELLSNIDLIEDEVQELSSEAIKNEIILSLEVRMIEDVTWEIVAILEKAKWGAVLERDGDEERRLDLVLRNLLKDLALRLVEVDQSQTYDILHQLFERQILEFRELPMKLQRKLLAEKWTNQFLEHDRDVLQSFRALTDAEEYQRFLRNLDLVLPELLERAKVAHVAGLISILSAHAEDDRVPDRVRLAATAMEEFRSPDNLTRLRDFAEGEERTVRTHALQVLGALGTDGLVTMMDLIAVSPTSMVRRDLLAYLQRQGDRIHPMILGWLGQKGQHWYVYRNMIHLAGKTGCDQAVGEVRRFLTYYDRRVREEAALTLFALLGPKAAPHLEKLLVDEDWRVVRRALVLLADAGCRSHTYFVRLVSIVETPFDPKDDRVSEAMTETALAAIERAGDFALPSGEAVGQYLLDRLLGGRGRLLKKILGARADGLPDKTREGICRTLGVIGDRTLAEAMARGARQAGGDLDVWLRNGSEAIYARINSERKDWSKPDA